MPTYTYQCSECDSAFEQFQKFSEEPLTVCPSCGGPIKRVMHAPGIVFKGSGWYINDSRKSGSSDSSSPSSDTPASAPAATPSESTPAPAPAAAKAAD